MHFSEGNFYDDVELELIKDEGISRPRMPPVEGFPVEMRVEVSRQLRELFSLGTRFKANVKVCQKLPVLSQMDHLIYGFTKLGFLFLQFRTRGLLQN